MKIVLVAYYFPPDSQVGGLRARNVANALAAAGHYVHVIAAAHDGVENVTRVADRITVERVRPLPGAREIYARARQLRRPAQRPQPHSVEGKVALPTRIPAWKRFLFSLIWLPDDRKGWVTPVVARARAHIRDGAELVYTTAPPFSVNLAGLLLKKLTGVRWFAEFRDPWIGADSKPQHVRSGFADYIDKWLERWCLRTADRVIAVTDASAALMQTKVKTRSKVAVVRNGIERVEQVSSTRPTNMVRVVYAGTLYFGRDPRAFLAAIATLRQRGRLRHDVRIDFVGDCRWYYEVSIEAFVQQLGIADCVHFHDWLPRADVQRLMEEASILLLLAQKQPLQVPNKLYEYLGTRKLILAFADADGESACMLRAAGGHISLDSADPLVIEAAVESAVNANGVAAVDERVLQGWMTSHQMNNLCQTVEMQFA